MLDEMWVEDDAGKSAERSKEGEVVPSWGEVIHVDDVVQLLAFYNTFCRHKDSQDYHIAYAWRCKLLELQVGKPRPPSWNASTNRAVERIPGGKNGAQGEVPKTTAQFCGSRFLRQHVLIGDDPREIPFGDVDTFYDKVLRPHGMARLSP